MITTPEPHNCSGFTQVEQFALTEDSTSVNDSKYFGTKRKLVAACNELGKCMDKKRIGDRRQTDFILEKDFQKSPGFDEVLKRWEEQL